MVLSWDFNMYLKIDIIVKFSSLIYYGRLHIYSRINNIDRSQMEVGKKSLP